MKLPINDLKRHNGPLDEILRAAITRVLDRGYYILGPENDAFEQEFVTYLGAGWAIGVGNGTDALELALRALGVVQGDEVITVANAGMYAGTAIRAVGAVPCYVDIEPQHLLMDPAALAEAITPGVTAIVVTHLYGRMADMSAILAIARSHGVPVIEDCAQSHGARRAGRRAGTWGDLATFSFYPTKNLGALGDGGMVVGFDEVLHSRVRSIRQYGWERTKYECRHPGGRNSRLDEVQAAVLRAKLPLLDGWNARRREIARRIGAAVRGLGWDFSEDLDESDVAHLCVVRTGDRDMVRAALNAQGIGCDVHYPIPDHRQPAYPDGHNYMLPVTETACRTVLTLPCFPEMRDEEVDRVIAACHQSALRREEG
ncbi:MAG: DegT/DnrJ/EryC1/StrS family aminotransferase [Castellaniella sp.]|nr:DegT/DnrJ/EryC1/StrS family aminotransferase [Castellaniella sp.]